MDVVENARLLRAKLARYHEQHERDGERPRVCQGVFSFMYMGEWTDAIELCEKEIAQNDAEATSLRLQVAAQAPQSRRYMSAGRGYQPPPAGG